MLALDDDVTNCHLVAFVNGFTPRDHALIDALQQQISHGVIVFFVDGSQKTA